MRSVPQPVSLSDLPWISPFTVRCPQTWQQRILQRDTVDGPAKSCTTERMVETLQCEAPKTAKLVQITPITMVNGTYNYSYWGL